MSAEVHLDRLLGRRVLAGNNRPIGRLEEFHAQDLVRECNRRTEQQAGEKSQRECKKARGMCRRAAVHRCILQIDVVGGTYRFPTLRASRA